MATGKLADMLGIVGNLGLIIGLLLVGYQIKQTNDLATAQLLSDGHATTMTIDLAFVGEQGPEMLPKANYSPGKLSDQDILILERMFRAKFSEQMRLIRLREVGLTSASETFQAQEFAYEINSAFGRMYWDISKDAVPLSPSFIAAVDRNLAEVAEIDRVAYYRSEMAKRQRQ
jgi:hypothetical protein